MIYVIGSINLDFVFSSTYFPRIGETIIGNSLELFPGGKGANQAYNAAKSQPTRLIGSVGDDLYSGIILKHLKDVGVDTSFIRKGKGPTGSAFINIAEGDNKIVVVPGANEELQFPDIEMALSNILETDIVLIQNELNKDLIEEVSIFLHKNNIRYIYNPAPFINIAEHVFRYAWYLTPNETEYSQLRQSFGSKFDHKIILTLGREGVKTLCDNKTFKTQRVEAIDTTGAGDAFSGSLAAALIDFELHDAIIYACSIATEMVTKKGAQGVALQLEKSD